MTMRIAKDPESLISKGKSQRSWLPVNHSWVPGTLSNRAPALTVRSCHSRIHRVHDQVSTVSGRWRYLRTPRVCWRSILMSHRTDVYDYEGSLPNINVIQCPRVTIANNTQTERWLLQMVHLHITSESESNTTRTRDSRQNHEIRRCTCDDDILGILGEVEFQTEFSVTGKLSYRQESQYACRGLSLVWQVWQGNWVCARLNLR